MGDYRCYLLDADDHILQAHDIECDDDTQAQSAARRFLTRDPYQRAVEVWQRTCRIITLDRQGIPGRRHRPTGSPSGGSPTEPSGSPLTAESAFCCAIDRAQTRRR